jgi:hypothetical protein
MRSIRRGERHPEKWRREPRNEANAPAHLKLGKKSRLSTFDRRIEQLAIMLKISEFRQIHERNELVVFGGSYKDVLPAQLKRLNTSRVYLVVSKSLAESTSELEVSQNLLKDQIMGTKIGVLPHGFFRICSR